MDKLEKGIRYLPYMLNARPVANLIDGYKMIIPTTHPSYRDGDIVYIWRSIKLSGLEDVICVRCITIDHFPEKYRDIFTHSSDVALPVELYETLNYGKLSGKMQIFSLPYSEFHNWNRYHELLPQYEKEIDELYPLCVLKDRYGGVYSGGKWTAWISGIDWVPEGIFGDDVECAICWDNLRNERKAGKILFGVGNSVDEALRELLRCYKYTNKGEIKNGE